MKHSIIKQRPTVLSMIKVAWSNLIGTFRTYRKLKRQHKMFIHFYQTYLDEKIPSGWDIQLRDIFVKEAGRMIPIMGLFLTNRWNKEEYNKGAYELAKYFEDIGIKPKKEYNSQTKYYQYQIKHKHYYKNRDHMVIVMIDKS